MRALRNPARQLILYSQPLTGAHRIALEPAHLSHAPRMVRRGPRFARAQVRPRRGLRRLAALHQTENRPDRYRPEHQTHKEYHSAHSCLHYRSLYTIRAMPATDCSSGAAVVEAKPDRRAIEHDAR